MERSSGPYKKSSSNKSSSSNAFSSSENSSTIAISRRDYNSVGWKAHRVIERREMKTINELLSRLLKECGWEDEVRQKVRAAWERRGIDANINDVLREMLPIANRAVPPIVYMELELHLRNILRSRYKL